MVHDFEQAAAEQAPEAPREHAGRQHAGQESREQAADAAARRMAGTSGSAGDGSHDAAAATGDDLATMGVAAAMLASGARPEVRAASSARAERAEKPPAPLPPAVVLSNYDGSSPELDHFVQALNASAIDPRTTVYVGTYGVSSKQAKFIADAHARCKLAYAPMFGMVRHHGGSEAPFWEARQHGAKGDVAHDGVVPELAGLGQEARHRDHEGESGNAHLYGWGREIGRRMRDSIDNYNESAQGKTDPIETWQLDEVWPSAAKVEKGPDHPLSPVELRELTRGVLTGLTYGRGADHKMQGIVYLSNTAVGLAREKPTGELTRFWRTLDDSATRIVGEEYPRFQGSPEAEAKRQFERGQGAMEKWRGKMAGVGDDLADKYVSGSSPGYSPSKDLGGLPKDKHGHPTMSRQEADAWRDRYMEARGREGANGFGEFGFTGSHRKGSTDAVNGNQTQKVADSVIEAMAKGLKSRHHPG